jgi:plasmid maintenance system antidote protein VapI
MPNEGMSEVPPTHPGEMLLEEYPLQNDWDLWHAAQALRRAG